MAPDPEPRYLRTWDRETGEVEDDVEMTEDEAANMAQTYLDDASGWQVGEDGKPHWSPPKRPPFEDAPDPRDVRI